MAGFFKTAWRRPNFVNSMGNVAAPVTAIFDTNGSTDYVEAFVYMYDTTVLGGAKTLTYFSGSLL